MPLRGEDGEELLTVAEAAAELGIKPATVRTLISNGRITVVRLNERTPLIPRTTIDAYRRTSRGKPGPKRQQEPVAALTLDRVEDRPFVHDMAESLEELGPDRWRNTAAVLAAEDARVAKIMRQYFELVSREFTAQEMSRWWAGTLPRDVVHRHLRFSIGNGHLTVIYPTDEPTEDEHQ